MAISLDQATFAGFVLEAIFYGVYIVLFLLSLNFLLHRQRRRPISRFLVFADCLLFALCTTHFALIFQNVDEGLITEPSIITLADETSGLLGADMLFSITDFFGELVLIYRCYVIWGHNMLAILFPLLLCLSGLSCALGGLGLIVATDPNATFAPPAIVPLGTASFALPLCVNVLVTSLIIGRILYISHSNGVPSGIKENPTFLKISEHIWTALGILIESGLLYLVAQLLVVIFFATGSNAQAIVVPAALQIYGIAPTLILVRVGLGITSERSISESLNLSSNVKFSKRQSAIIETFDSRAHSNDTSLSEETAVKSIFEEQSHIAV